MADLSKIVSNITLHDTIWWSDKRTTVSYPEDGNQTYMQIENDSFWYKHRNDCILQAVTNYGLKEKPFLEIGGGNGYVAQALLNAGFEMIMLEPDPVGVNNARLRGVKNLICAPFEECHCIADSVGGIGLFDVLEHIDNDVGFLKKLRLLLSPGGSLFITVPAYPLLWSAEDIHDGHKRRYTIHSIKKALHESGFSCHYVTGFFQLLVGPIFLFRTLPYHFNIKRKQTMSTYRRENGILMPALSRLAKQMLTYETSMLRKGLHSGFGASILVVAR